MADAPIKVSVQSRRVDSSILPITFSQPYRLYVIQQNTDMLNVADAANNAGELAYNATVKNEEQDVTLANHDVRITANTNAINLIEVRLTTAEGKIVVLRGDVDYLLGEVIDIQADIGTLQSEVTSIQSDYVSKTATANQMVQPVSGALLVGNVTTPTTDRLQVLGSENVSVSYKVAGLQVVNARKTGWTAATGTAYRGAFNADQSMPVGTTYSQSEVQAISNNLLVALRRIKALEDDLRSHGLIN